MDHQLQYCESEWVPFFKNAHEVCTSVWSPDPLHTFNKPLCLGRSGVETCPTLLNGPLFNLQACRSGVNCTWGRFPQTKALCLLAQGHHFPVFCGGWMRGHRNTWATWKSGNSTDDMKEQVILTVLVSTCRCICVFVNIMKKIIMYSCIKYISSYKYYYIISIWSNYNSSVLGY